MKKRILSLALAAVMALSLAACGSKEEAPAAPSSTPAVSSTPADPNKPLAMGDTANPVTLSIVIKDRSPENADDAAWIATLNEKLLEAGIGAQLELIAMQSGSYATNLGLMLSGGTIPDLIWFQGGDEEFALTQQILADLTPYIENSVYMKGVMEEYMLERISNYPYLVYLCEGPRHPLRRVRQPRLQGRVPGRSLRGQLLQDVPGAEGSGLQRCLDRPRRPG